MAGETADQVQRPLEQCRRVMKAARTCPPIRAGKDCLIAELLSYAVDFIRNQSARLVPSHFNELVRPTERPVTAFASSKPILSHEWSKHPPFRGGPSSNRLNDR